MNRNNSKLEEKVRNKRPKIMLFQSGKLKYTFDKIVDVGKFLELPTFTMRRIINSNQTFKGFTFRKSNQDLTDVETNKGEYQDTKQKGGRAKKGTEVYQDGKLIKTFPTMVETAEFIGVKQNVLSQMFTYYKRDKIEYKGFTIKKSKSKSQLERERVDKEFKKLLLKSKKIPEWCWKEEESVSEKKKKQEYEEYLSTCCTRSKDDKIWIPNSLLKEIPQLIEFTMPKSML